MYRIMRATAEHDDALTHISSAAFGEGFLGDLPALRTTRIGFVVCTEEGEAVGFVFGELHDQASLAKLLPTAAAYDRMYGVIDPLAVHHAHQCKGLGARLLEAVTAALQELGATYLVAPAWGYRTSENCVRVNAAPLLWAHGFNLRTHAPRYWQAPCTRGDFTCPYKTNPCTCSMSVYCKDLLPEE